MPLENVKLEKKNAIAYVTIDRPKVLNALNMATMRELWQVFSELKDDKQVRVVILTGSGEKAFVAGADINELAKNSPVEAKAYTHKGQATLELIENLGKPVIACMNGFALGGGCEIAMACTMRIAGENAKLGQPEVKLGLIPGYGGTQRLPRLVGPAKAKELIWSGRQVKADEALAIGLVDRVVPAAEVEEHALGWASELASGAVVAMGLAKDMIDSGLDGSLSRGLDMEIEAFVEVFGTDDARVGVKSFLEHGPGKAKFSGR